MARYPIPEGLSSFRYAPTAPGRRRAPGDPALPFIISLWPMNALRVFIEMYRDGFRQMTVGRTLWALVIIKLLILFCVVKLFFFPDILERDYDSDAQRAEAVRTHLAPP